METKNQKHIKEHMKNGALKNAVLLIELSENNSEFSCWYHLNNCDLSKNSEKVDFLFEVINNYGIIDTILTLGKFGWISKVQKKEYEHILKRHKNNSLHPDCGVYKRLFKKTDKNELRYIG